MLEYNAKTNGTNYQNKNNKGEKEGKTIIIIIFKKNNNNNKKPKLFHFDKLCIDHGVLT